MQPTTSVADKFDRWVVSPLAALRKIPNGDGAFASLSIAFSLYERYLVSKLELLGDSSPSKRYELASLDFDSMVTAGDFQDFWDMFRVGIQHYLQPKNFTKGKDKTRWGWDISEQKGYKKYPVTVNPEPDLFKITIDPWAFVDHVLVRWKQTPELIDSLDKFVFGEIKHHQQIQPQIDFAQAHRTLNQNDASTSMPTDHDPPATGIYPKGM